MARTFHTVATTGLMLVGLGLTALTTGCGVAEQVAQETTEKIIENQTGVDVDVNQEGTTLPDTWPTEVPVISGDVSNAGSISAGGGSTWTAQVAVSDAKKGYDEAKQKLLDAGYTVQVESEAGGMYVATLTGNSHDVALTGTSDPNGDFINYLVTKKSS